MAIVMQGPGTRAAGCASAARGGSTCPWGPPAIAAPPAVVSQLPRPRPKRDTCPWGDMGSESTTAPRRRGAHVPPPRDTCPWSGPQKAVQLLPPLHQDATAAVSAAQRAGVGQRRCDELPEKAHENTLHPEAAIDVTSRPDQEMDVGPGRDASEEQERQMLIQRCLENGLEEEQILEILEEYENQKLLRKTREQQERKRAEAASVVTAGPKSVAAQRMAKASDANSAPFGPTDHEVVGILEEGRRLTPQTRLEAIPNSLASRRAKAKGASEAAVGSFDTERSRAAYLQSQQQAAAAKSRNRGGSGIF